MVLSLERTTNIGRNNISQFLLEDFKIGHQSLTHFYFGCILSHRTKVLKKKKGSFEKTNRRGKSTARSKHTSIIGNRAGAVCQGTWKPQSPSPLTLWCVPASVPGRRAPQHVERQTVLLAPTCSSGQSPGRTWPCRVPVILPSLGTPGTLLGECQPKRAEVTSFTSSSMSGVRLKDTPSVRSYGVCVLAKEK